MKRAWFLVLAAVTAAVVGFGGVAVGSDERHDDGRHHAGPPDTFVTDWDVIGTQAFTAAALTPAEGHTIFAYVAIAVYDSVVAIEGGYEPFAIEVVQRGQRDRLEREHDPDDRTDTGGPVLG